MNEALIQDIKKVVKYLKVYPEQSKKLKIKDSDFYLPGIESDIACDIGSVAKILLATPDIQKQNLIQSIGDTSIEVDTIMNYVFDGNPFFIDENEIENMLIDWRISREIQSFDTSSTTKQQALQNLIENLTKIHRVDSSEANEIRAAIIDADSFLRTSIETPPELLQGILYQGDKMIVNASSKIGKTWFLLRLGMAISEGVPWLGIKTTKAGVLFVNFELKRHVIQKRIKKIKDDILPNSDLKNFHFLNVREMNQDAGNVIKTLADIKDTIEQKNIGAVILDPIYKAYGAEMDENSAGDIANLLKGLERITTTTNASVIFSHHYTKGNQGGKFSIDRASGSGVFARDPDTIVNITALEDGDENSSYVVDVSVRAFKPVPSFGIKIKDGKVVTDKGLDLKNIRRPNGKFTSKFNKEQLLEILAEKPVTQTELEAEAKRRFDMSHGSFVAYFKEAKKVEGVHENEDKKWFYTRPVSNS